MGVGGGVGGGGAPLQPAPLPLSHNMPMLGLPLSHIGRSRWSIGNFHISKEHVYFLNDTICVMN